MLSHCYGLCTLGVPCVPTPPIPSPQSIPPSKHGGWDGKYGKMGKNPKDYVLNGEHDDEPVDFGHILVSCLCFGWKSSRSRSISSQVAWRYQHCWLPVGCLHSIHSRDGPWFSERWTFGQLWDGTRVSPSTWVPGISMVQWAQKRNSEKK